MRLASPTIGVVGGTGRMGGWFMRFFERSGLKVSLVGTEDDGISRDLVEKCDVVLVSVPMGVAVDVIREVGPAVREDALLADVTSIKKAPLEEMLRGCRSQVVGTHPLFGPDASDATGLRIVLCPGRGASGLNWLKGLFESSGMRPVVMGAEEHDRMMGIVQGVNHFLTISMALCLEGSGFSLETLLNCATQTFQRRVDRIRSLLEQPAGLFGGILMDNPEAERCVGQLICSEKTLADLVERGDKAGFERMFEELRAYFCKESTGEEGKDERDMGKG